MIMIRVIFDIQSTSTFKNFIVTNVLLFFKMQIA